MKNLLYLVILTFLLTFNASADDLIKRELTCSFNGTDLIFINGILASNRRTTHLSTLAIKAAISKNLIDAKSKVSFKTSHNSSIGFPGDLFESYLQKNYPENFIDPATAYVFAYHLLNNLPKKIPLGYLAKSFNVRVEIINFMDSISDKFFVDTLVSEEIKKLSIAYEQANTEFKSILAESLLDFKKVIVVSHSQGNMFVNNALDEYSRGEELAYEGIADEFTNYQNVFTNVRVAPPKKSGPGNSKYIKNDWDINSFFEPDSNVPLSRPNVLNDPRSKLEMAINHSFRETYLNEYQIQPQQGEIDSLEMLRSRTLQLIVDATSELETNCPTANFQYKASGKAVAFDAIDVKENPRKPLLYIWDFGDGSPIQKTPLPKIEHIYTSSSSYIVTLRVTNRNDENVDYGEEATEEKLINLNSSYVYGDLGECGFMEGIYHMNPDGSKGGFVHRGSLVDPTVTLPYGSAVCDNSTIKGNSKFSGTVNVNRSNLIDVQINVLFQSPRAGIFQDSNVRNLTTESIAFPKVYNSNIADSVLIGADIYSLRSNFRSIVVTGSRYIGDNSQYGTRIDFRDSSFELLTRQTSLSTFHVNWNFLEISAGYEGQSNYFVQEKSTLQGIDGNFWQIPFF